LQPNPLPSGWQNQLGLSYRNFEPTRNDTGVTHEMRWSVAN
jgi:hypothetical protein